MLKKGKKTLEWEQIRKKLKVEFEKRDITSCELRLAGCWINNALSFAHIDKRRFLSADQLRIVVLACVPCHSLIEAWPREKMRIYLENIIKNRHEVLH